MPERARRHPNVVHVDEVPAREEKRGRFGFRGKRIWPEAKGKSLACSWFEVPPGKQAFPHHFHSAFEEAIFILEGEGTARIGEDRVAVGPGDYIAYPPGPAGAHSLINTGKEPLRYLCFSTVQTLDIVVYPDSKKIAFAAGVDPAKGLRAGGAWVMRLIKDQPSVDYYEGENTGEDPPGDAP
jgi:mannose-6-phosphate isomerase-like protein (cupin superfamily)